MRKIGKTNVDEELLPSMSDLELFLIEEYEVMEVRGKVATFFGWILI